MKVAKNLLGVLCGVSIAGMLFFAASSAFAYSQVRVMEGESGSYRVKLPTFPHEARRRSKGYEAVRYRICTEDGSAKGGYSASFFGSNYPEGTDYPKFCPTGWKVTFTSAGRYSKYLDLTPSTVEDSEKEGEEDYWIKLTNPEVIPGGGSSWQSHSGSHHIPSTIKVQVIIVDDD